MELTTRCPNCETVFAVALEQLQLRKGYIRCIQCAHIFDAYEAVVPESRQAEARAESRPAETRAELRQAEPRVSQPPVAQPPVQANPRSGGVSESVPASGGPVTGRDPFYIPPPEQLPDQSRAPARPFSIGPGAPGAHREPAFRTPAVGTPSVESRLPEEPRIPSVLRERGTRAGQETNAPSFTIADTRPLDIDVDGHPEETLYVGEPAQPGQALYMEPRSGHRSRGRPELFDGPQQRSGWASMLWGLLILLGLATLLLQGAYVYRAQLANHLPQLRPVLESACARLGCSVPYDRRIEAIAITGSALRASISTPAKERAAEAQEGVSQLTLDVTLRNTFERPQEWPTLVLDLKDASGAVVVRRNLPPDVWVPAQLRGGPFAAGSEVAIQVPVTVRGLQANGYQLDKFFP